MGGQTWDVNGIPSASQSFCLTSNERVKEEDMGPTKPHAARKHRCLRKNVPNRSIVVTAHVNIHLHKEKK
ncbi:hypothetical protein AAFF_G00105360 [Aldrovandia affinis]|uniref:Uncharacterized protein n=1 Tax=Aldrovandia affinis TaxID=143900 RepID=A0AAD7T1Z7_9TELE|nr:hypothetical protein AAFF_G00105360 [Aldrovandia affinis]